MVILRMSKKTKKRILFIVEGDTDEPEFFKQAKAVFYHEYEIEYYTYCTSIHDLIDALFQDEQLDKDIDIRRTLRAKEKDPEKKDILKEKYTDIFLVFDMEPHYQKQHFSVIEQMLAYYCDSEKMGKLFINYPMMQSYKHINRMPDSGFIDQVVTKEAVQEYKKLVGQETAYQDVRKYDYRIFMSMCAHHLKKANYILNQSSDLMGLKEFINIDYVTLFQKQLDKWNRNNCVYVLNTSIFWILEYKPNLLLKKLKQNSAIFYI